MLSRINLVMPAVIICALVMMVPPIVSATPSTKGKSPTTSEQPSPSHPIDINSATLADLQALPGVGVVTAQKIVEGRPYTSIDDLKTRNIVKGKTYDKIRNLVSVKAPKGALRRDPSPMPSMNAN
ncbi:MAG: helix-hairpin-helix domain-containing protein [Nitrospira sp.]|nr:helix-hairpin-helix domain-containing protein [Nitrospira sp.]